MCVRASGSSCRRRSRPRKKRLDRHVAKTTTDTWNRLKRYGRYRHGQSRWIQKSQFKLRYIVSTSTRTMTGHRDQDGDDDWHTLFARASCNANSASTLVRRSGIRCSSHRNFRRVGHAINDPRPWTSSISTAAHGLDREQGHREAQSAGHNPASGHGAPVDPAPCESPKPSDPQGCRRLTNTVNFEETTGASVRARRTVTASVDDGLGINQERGRDEMVDSCGDHNLQLW